MNDKDPKKELDELIRLMRKLQKSESFNRLQEEKEYFKNLESLLNDYEKYRDMMPENFMEELSPEIKSLINILLNDLKTELNESGDLDKETSLDLDSIDEILKNNNLSEKEINDLLDQRSKM